MDLRFGRLLAIVGDEDSKVFKEGVVVWREPTSGKVLADFVSVGTLGIYLDEYKHNCSTEKWHRLLVGNTTIIVLEKYLQTPTQCPQHTPKVNS